MTLIVGFALLAFSFQTAAPVSPEPVKWESDWKAAFTRAKAERRLVFVDYFANWCEPCLQMERRVFPDPAVADVLHRFVLLKVDYDRSNAVASYGVRALPTYVVCDPWENERLRFAGFRDAEEFARKLSVAAEATPALVDASGLLNESAIEGHLALGRAYLQVRAPKYARDEFDRASKLAKRAGKADVAQIAETESAWMLDDQAAKAIRLLERIAAQPVDPSCGAAAWLAIGHAHRRLGEVPAAAEAYGRAVAAAPDGSALRMAAQSAFDAVAVKK